MKQQKATALIYTVLHFMVDFTTILLIANFYFKTPNNISSYTNLVVTYNLVAFAGQLPIGIFADMLNKNRLLAIIGCLLACISYPMSHFSTWTSCIFAALGNGFFHVGAGADILKMSFPKAGLSGLFVSSGALGVWLAYKITASVAMWVCPCFMLLAAATLYLCPERKENDCITTITYRKPDIFALSAVILFMFTIVLRSLLGTIVTFSWKSVPLLSFLFVLSIAFGKAVGGFIGDVFGYIKIAAISLAVSLISFIFAFEHSAAGMIAIFCFNMTMPLTLTAITDATDKKYGFSFGLTTFALAIGFIPVVFGANDWFGKKFALLTVLTSLILLLGGYQFLRLHKQKEKD